MDQNNTDPKQALVDKIKDSTNILVTVSSNPSVDELSACLGLTLWLNKLGKHATAVFSGEVPSTIEFLKPEETLEKNTDSLRDFIIALDKSKADKLRYKVEENVVKIFITPYRTSLSADDLEYSQGDFNVDMVVALGVQAQEELDVAITAHGRILHDATVATITTGDTASELGSISWHDTQASSLSELVVDLGSLLGKDELDNQIATALLTGVVAETARFSNEKTTPQTMSVSAQLMSAGANQQLVASKLEQPPKFESPAPAQAQAEAEVPSPAKDGTLEITHEVAETPLEPEFDLPAPEEPSVEPEAEEPTDAPLIGGDSSVMTEPPARDSMLTANSAPEDVMTEPSSDPLSAPASEQPLLDHSAPGASEPSNEELQPAPPTWMPPQPWLDQPAEPSATPPAPTSDQPTNAEPQKTLAELEREVDSPHVEDEATEDNTPTPDLDSARDEVMKAINSTPPVNPEPISALNAQPIDLSPPAPEPQPAPDVPLPSPVSTAFDPTAFDVMNDPETANHQPVSPLIPTVDTPPVAEAPAPELTGPVEQPFTLPLPGSPLAPPPANPVPPTSVVDDPTAPPPVPPPLPPNFPPAR